jgi:hypothetical protein
MNRKISVRRAVFAAAAELEILADSGKGINPSDLAEQKIADFQAADDKDGVRFWRDVWLHLMFKKYMPAEICIVEEEKDIPKSGAAIIQPTCLHHD